jgi:hypothetical protein
VIALLDGNVLCALLIDSHLHYARTRSWFHSSKEHFATTLITEGTLLRVHMAIAQDPSAHAAWHTLSLLRHHPRHVFWKDNLPWNKISHHNLQGPKQVTDARLAQIARHQKGRLYTLDTALSELHSDVARLLPG